MKPDGKSATKMLAHRTNSTVTPESLASPLSTGTGGNRRRNMTISQKSEVIASPVTSTFIKKGTKLDPKDSAGGMADPLIQEQIAEAAIEEEKQDELERPDDYDVANIVVTNASAGRASVRSNKEGNSASSKQSASKVDCELDLARAEDDFERVLLQNEDI